MGFHDTQEIGEPFPLYSQPVPDLLSGEDLVPQPRKVSHCQVPVCIQLNPTAKLGENLHCRFIVGLIHLAVHSNQVCLTDMLSSLMITLYTVQKVCHAYVQCICIQKSLDGHNLSSECSIIKLFVF